VVIAAAVSGTLLFMHCSLAQFRPGGAGPLRHVAPGGSVRARALADAPALRAATVPGAAPGRARVLPRRGHRREARLPVRPRPDTARQAVLPPSCAVTAGTAESAVPHTAYPSSRLSAASPRLRRVR
jgi:hypothetical protein